MTYENKVVGDSGGVEVKFAAAFAVGRVSVTRVGVGVAVELQVAGVVCWGWCLSIKLIGQRNG